MSGTAVLTDVSVELLVGAMDEQQCESDNHVEGARNHDGPATHYVRINHDCKNYPASSVLAVCAPFTAYVRALDPAYDVICQGCMKQLTVTGWGEIIGEVGK
jgi:hypothetical protein